LKWVNGLSILLWALSAVFFIYSHIFSAQKSGSGEVIAIGVNGERILLDTLLAGGQIGLVISESNLSAENFQSPESPQVNDTSFTVPDVPPPPKTPCININNAAEAQLISIRGVGPVLAASIIRHREEKGKFRKKEDLLAVRGIGNAKMEQIGQQVCF